MNATLAGAVTVALVLAAGSALAEGNETRGERLFNQQCKACHTLEQGGHNLVGPNLHGLFGRKAGSADYQYSDAMKKSGITWDEKTLADYLKDPKGKVLEELNSLTSESAVSLIKDMEAELAKN